MDVSYIGYKRLHLVGEPFADRICRRGSAWGIPVTVQGLHVQSKTALSVMRALAIACMCAAVRKLS